MDKTTIVYEHQQKDFWSVHTVELKDFLYRAAKHGYASEDAVDHFSDGTHVMVYNDGDWGMMDTWYGGDPFRGMTVVTYCNRACWSMIYDGKVFDLENRDAIINDCLRPALRAVKSNYPWRGPTNFTPECGLMHYRKRSSGKISEFRGIETIKDIAGNVVYLGRFSGGYVDRH